MKFFLALFSFLALVGPAHAAWDDSYAQTCNVSYEDSWRIQAWCLDRSGQYQWNDFNRSGCIRGVYNEGGYLTCERGGGDYSNRLPRGSYLQTCRSCNVSGQVLSCRCDDRNGYERYTTIYYRGCRGPITNTNGQLTCN